MGRGTDSDVRRSPTPLGVVAVVAVVVDGVAGLTKGGAMQGYMLGISENIKAMINDIIRRYA